MEPNQMGAAGQPMPNQQIPTQPQQPVMEQTMQEQAMTTEQFAPAGDMTMEEQMAAAMQEQPMDQSMVESTSVVEGPKKNNGMLIGMVLAVVAAVAGIAFGVIMMLSGNGKVSDLEKQVSSLKSTNSNLQSQLDEVEALNGDEALALLQTAVVSQSLPYGIGYANVYAKYDGDEDLVAYWVKYLPINVPEGVGVANDIIFTMNDEGNWEFTLPGFSGYTQELADNYVLLDGNAVPAPAPAPAPAPEEPEE